MIWTQVVAIIPPNNTYASITAPTPTTAHSYGMPNSSVIRLPAPTIWAMV